MHSVVEAVKAHTRVYDGDDDDVITHQGNFHALGLTNLLNTVKKKIFF